VGGEAVAVTAKTLDYSSTRLRTSLYIGDLFIVGACAEFAAVIGRHWSWGPFAVGLVIGVLGIVGTVWIQKIAIRVLRPTRDQLDRARQGLRARNIALLPGYVAFGTSAGLIAGSLRSYWPDVVLTTMVIVLGFLVPLALVRVAQRRAHARRNAGSPSA
jgi:hypothetical protein